MASAVRSAVAAPSARPDNRRPPPTGRLIWNEANFTPWWRFSGCRFFATTMRACLTVRMLEICHARRRHCPYTHVMRARTALGHRSRPSGERHPGIRDGWRCERRRRARSKRAVPPRGADGRHNPAPDKVRQAIRPGGTARNDHVLGRRPPRLLSAPARRTAASKKCDFVVPLEQPPTPGNVGPAQGSFVGFRRAAGLSQMSAVERTLKAAVRRFLHHRHESLRPPSALGERAQRFEWDASLPLLRNELNRGPRDAHLLGKTFVPPLCHQGVE